MLVVNLFGAPGSGKSTGAAQIFSELKLRGYNCELITEFAKDMVWERNDKAFANQMYIFGQQSQRLSRMENEVDIVITDSPLPMSVMYIDEKINKSAYTRVVMDTFNQYDNMNFFIWRSKPYNPKGRNQTEKEANTIAQEMFITMANIGISFTSAVRGEKEQYSHLVNKIIEKIEGDKTK